jgi:hypothetical protein
VGGFDSGRVPPRYYVLYAPLFSALLSVLPASAAPLCARLLGCVAWFGVLALVVLAARRDTRRVTLLGAVFVAGVYSLTLFGASGRPDALAVLLAGLGLLRSARRGRVDAVAALLFALAPFLKPNVVGLAAGVVIVDVVRRRLLVVPALLAGIALALTIMLALHRVSHGTWLTHLLLSTGQPLSGEQWVDQVPSRLQFLGLPIAGAFAAGWRLRREDGVALALGALGASLAWAMVCGAKIGSATNYWMEPCLAALVVVSRAPLPPLGPTARMALASAALGQALWTGVASVRSSVEQVAWRVPASRRIMARARSVCGATAGDVMLGDEIGIELALDGRIVIPPFQTTHLVRRGLFPASLWIAEIERPQIAGVVMEDGLLERPPSEVNALQDRYPPEVRRALQERFALTDQQGDWRVYCRR